MVCISSRKNVNDKPQEQMESVLGLQNIEWIKYVSVAMIKMGICQFEKWENIEKRIIMIHCVRDMVY